LESVKTPVDNGGSFSYPGADAGIPETGMPHHLQLLVRNTAYRRYMRMPKGMMPKDRVAELTGVYDDLRHETEPTYVWTAGWTAVEAALAADDQPQEVRLGLLHSGANRWTQAFWKMQEREVRNDPGDIATLGRMALTMATLPLLDGVVRGKITDEAWRKSFGDCLMVARFNAMKLQEARAKGNHRAIGYYTGLANECNTLLTLNYHHSRWTAIPAMARCDSGYYNNRQTHDLLAIRHKKGRVTAALPMEIKSSGKRVNRNRYLAMVVIPNQDFVPQGLEIPEHMLRVVGAMYEGEANHSERRAAHAANESLHRKIAAYRAGRVVGGLVSKTRFYEPIRDKLVQAGENLQLGQLAAAAM
jgi:hypothetical protein